MPISFVSAALQMFQLNRLKCRTFREARKTTIHDILAVSEDVAHEIFEYLLNEDYDYTVIRKISKSFRKVP